MSLDSKCALINYPISLSIELKDFHLMCEMFENGAKLKSHSGLAVAADPDGFRWHLIVYPNGEKVDYKGHVTVFLKCSGGDKKHRRYTPGTWTVTGADGTIAKKVSADKTSSLTSDFNCPGEMIPYVYVGPETWGQAKLCSHDDLQKSDCVDFIIRFTGTVHVLPNGDFDATAKRVTNVAPGSGTYFVEFTFEFELASDFNKVVAVDYVDVSIREMNAIAWFDVL